MRRVLPMLILLAVTAAACGGSEPLAEPSPSPTAIPRVEETTPPPPPSAPLTGLPMTDDGAEDRPVLAVKIDNHPKAHPQIGLDVADVVIEELVEGGTTRFIALYHSDDPGSVGPVRSGRDVDADLLPSFNPVVAISGAAAPVYQVLRGAGLKIFEEGQAGGAFNRDSSRPRPHNLFATASKLWEAAEDLPAAAKVWTFDENAPLGGEEVEAVTAAFSGGSRATWTWDANSSTWLRAQNGVDHMADTGRQLDAQNVVIAFVGVGSGGGVDSSGNRTAHIRVTGEGEGLLLRDGRVYQLRWRKADRESHFEWLTEDGRPLPLVPGRSWLELVPTGSPVDIQRPEPDPALPGASPAPASPAP